MSTAICSASEHGERAQAIARQLGLRFIEVERHHYPDGESGVRVLGDVAEHVIVVAELGKPDAQFLPLAFLLDALRELGASELTLVAPYLPYLRQDKRFRSGEAITSRTFARLLSTCCDRLITIDPHLHRYASLDEIYSLEGIVLSAAERVGEWIRDNVDDAVVIGPDSESRQWVERAAKAAHADFLVLEKTRHGDRHVDITRAAREHVQGKSPVLVDDIISSGHTMAEAVRGLLAQGAHDPVCIGVHALFDDEAARLLDEAGAARVVSTNTLPHATNVIDIDALLAGALEAYIR